LIAGAGYKVDLHRLRWIDAGLRSGIMTSVPGLHFTGLASALSFGPVMRFVYGTKHAAVILTAYLRRRRVRGLRR